MGDAARPSQEAQAFDAGDALRGLSHDELVNFGVMCAKNFFAIDGTWFQAVERACGMDKAMEHDREAWRRYTVSEAKRVRAFLGLPERCGLDGLARALPLKLTSLAHPVELRRGEGWIEFRVVACRVQVARARKNMPYHPCKSVGLVEYADFARTLDDRITCTCASCYPDVSDETCSCAWRFTLDECATEGGVCD